MKTRDELLAMAERSIVDAAEIHELVVGFDFDNRTAQAAIGTISAYSQFAQACVMLAKERMEGEAVVTIAQVEKEIETTAVMLDGCLWESEEIAVKAALTDMVERLRESKEAK